MAKRMIIAIDGPAASGKSTTARHLARLLGYAYLDTGAMYRACALKAKRLGLELRDEQAVNAMLGDLDIRIETDGQANLIRLDGEDVSAAIRDNDISALASAISALPAVRHKMVELQRKMAADGGVILDGRDIGTYVFPDADLKFFLTATPEVRAQRRWLELQKKGVEADLEQVLADLVERDRNDASRALAPLAKAADAIEIDTGSLSVNGQVLALYQIILDSSGEPLVLLAEHSGFCFGVRRAINLALEAKQAGKTVCTVGELIHNPRIVRELNEQGINACPEIAAVSKQVVVIRSHGIARQDLDSLVANGNEIIDATCPYVKRTQELVASMADYPVLILGDAEHPEVKAMLSYGNENTRVVQPDTDLGGQTWPKLCVVCQTTQKIANLRALADKLLPAALELRIFNTICLATTQRQESALALAARSDLMIVIGGRNSANTRMLKELCEARTTAVHIESADELHVGLLEGKQRIGLVAGASTPASQVIEVFNQIKKITGSPGAATRIEEIPLFKEESC